jgi:hypothetical protein
VEYRICLSSPPDREKLVAEIFFGDFQWAEINQDGAELQLECYPRPDGKQWSIPLATVEETLALAKERLMGNGKI